MKFIRDAIYGYVPLSPLENKLIGQSAIIRLHKVLQNSTLYLTYPNDSSARFSHSIGAMHVAGRLFKSAINNSDPQVISKIVSSAQAYLLGIKTKSAFRNAKNYLLQMQQMNGNNSSFYKELGWSFRNGGATLTASDFKTLTNNVLFQAVRLAALVHDVGHLPYSHICSYAIEDGLIQIGDNSDPKPKKALSEGIEALDREYFKLIASKQSLFATPQEQSVIKGDLHERIGLVLLNDLYQLGIQDPDERDFNELCLLIALQIIVVHQFGHVDGSTFRAFLKRNENLGIWYPLGNIISGSVDCDRLDYIIRDAYNSGAQEMISFDQDRIVNSISFSKQHPNRKLVINTNPLITVFDRRALSALTDFFHTRMRLFRWVTNHHNVVRTDLILHRLVLKLILIYENEADSRIKQFLTTRKFFRLWKFTNLTVDYRFIDDSWLEQLLLDLYAEISGEIKESDSEEMREVKFLLRGFLDREVKLFPSLWKRENGFIEFANGFVDFLKSLDLDSIISYGVKAQIQEVLDWESSTRAANHVISSWVKLQGLSPYASMLPIEQRVREAQGVSTLFVFKTFSAYKPVGILEGERRITNLDVMSTLVPRLDTIFREGLMLYGFRCAYSKEEPKLNLNELGGNVSRIIIDLFNEQGSELKQGITS